MTFALMGLGPSFDLQDWRDSVDARRSLVRSIVAEAIGGGRHVETMLEEVKRALSYGMMSKKDQDRFRRMAYQTRTVVSLWGKLKRHEREAFLSGKTPYSTVFTMVWERI